MGRGGARWRQQQESGAAKRTLPVNASHRCTGWLLLLVANTHHDGLLTHDDGCHACASTNSASDREDTADGNSAKAESESESAAAPAADNAEGAFVKASLLRRKLSCGSSHVCTWRLLSTAASARPSGDQRLDVQK